MTCAELEALLARQGTAPAEAGEHLLVCPACRARVARWEAARRELAAWRDEASPPFLHARLMAALRQAAAPAVPWWRRLPRTAWAGAGVAAVLVVAVASQGVLRHRAPPPAPTLADRETVATGLPELAADTARPPGDQPPLEPPAEAARAVEMELRAAAASRPSLSSPRRADAPPARLDEFAAQQDRDERGVPPPSPLVAEAPARPTGDGGEPAMGRFEPVPVAEERVMAAAAEVDGAAARLQTKGVAEQQPVASARAPATLPVALLTPANDRVATLILKPAVAPAPSQAWTLILSEDGRVALEGPPAEVLPEILPLWQRALAGLKLAPGRYRVVPLGP